MIHLRQACEPGFAKQRHVNGERQGNQARVGANVRRRLFAANMLFARRQRQHKTTAVIGINSFAAQTTGHLTDELLLRGKEPHTRATKGCRASQRLPLTDNDIGPHRPWWDDET